MKLVLVTTKNSNNLGAPIGSTKFIAFDFGIKEYRGIKYRLVSPYLDDRAKHWITLETEIVEICETSS